MNKYLSFMGLGKLGLPLATNFAKNGVHVLAIDINQKNIDLLNQKKCPFFEPFLQNNINLSSDNITYSSSSDGVSNTDLTIILVNTPSKKDGSFSNEYIFNCLKSVCDNLKKNNKNKHNFVISSTVMPNSFKKFNEFIEKEMNWKLNINFKIAYVPDFVALGNVIKDFENPDMLIVGSSDTNFGMEVADLYKKQIKKDCNICLLTLEEAEIAKISLNAYICTKISFANFLANLCENVENTNVDNITSAIGLDKRISPHYFKGGLSFGGTCFPRDTWAFINASENVGLDAVHIKSAATINEFQHKNLLRKVLLNMPVKQISIFGLGFKQNTSVITESSSIKLIEELLKNKYTIYVYEPVQEAVDNAKLIFKNNVNFCNTPEECFKSSKQAIFINPYKEFKDLEKIESEEYKILDCWRAFNFKKANVIRIGINDGRGYCFGT